MKHFHYYIFIDYSESFLGYIIIENEKIRELLSKVTKLKHYRNVKYKKEYLKSIKKTIERDKLIESLLKHKIRHTKLTLEVYTDIAVFLKGHKSCIVFISVDNKQYDNFIKLVKILGTDARIVKESDLKKDSVEYRLSLIIDNMLNLERIREQSK